MGRRTEEAAGSATVTEQLLQGVQAHIASGGDSGLSVRQLAAAAGRSTMCVYTAFGSRDKMLSAVHARITDDFLGALRGKDRACAATASRYLAQAAAEPHLFAFLFTAGQWDGAQEAASRILTGVLDLWERCPRGADDHALSCWALTHGHLVGKELVSPRGDLSAVVADGVSRLCLG